MIIPVIGINSLSEYETKKAALGELRPRECPSCAAHNSFWKHGSYIRKVLEGSKTADVKISRYFCSRCGLVVSCLFSFLVPYRHFSAAVIADAVERYSDLDISYRKEEGEISDLDSDLTPRPTHAQIFRWIASIIVKLNLLLFQLQKEIVMRGGCESLSASERKQCRKALKARTAAKVEALQRLVEFVELARLSCSTADGALAKTHALFLCNVESLQSIFSRHRLELPTPQNVQRIIF